MKSTYKLLGVFWDRHPTVSISPAIYNGVLPRNYSCEYDLFDTISFERSIKISDLLKIEHGDKIQSMIKKLQDCNKIVFVIDYFGKENNPTIQRLLKLRTSQCIEYFMERIPKAKVFITEPIV